MIKVNNLPQCLILQIDDMLAEMCRFGDVCKPKTQMLAQKRLTKSAKVTVDASIKKKKVGA